MAIWKRFFLIIIGLYLGYGGVVVSGPLYPTNAAERAGFYTAKAGMTILGIWLILRGVRLRRRDGPPAT